MPELPEVEVTRLGLRDVLRGRRIVGLRQGKPLRWPLGCAPDALVGLCIDDVARRGKYLLLRLDQGDLIVHLGMSGSLRWVVGEAPPPGAHDHFTLRLEGGELRLRDPRRFGAVLWHSSGADAPPHALLAHLGPEPLDPGFDGSALRRALRGRRAAVKPLLLDQRVVAGVGNIYACEALHRAGIDPCRAGGDVSPARCDRLAGALRETLAEAVAAGGSTLRDFAHADGTHGCFQHAARVYGRAGLPCPRCGALVRQITQAQRSTYYCPRCQRR